VTAQYILREDAAELDRRDAELTAQIEDTERRIVALRRKRDDGRFHRAELLAAANVLDNLGFRVERMDGGAPVVHVDQPVDPS
jgi:hypothetical protein